eukprot:m.164065 g.164065  ORF g.164065 m.164065 type:complete len:878 (+) comp16569_c1_seq1:48-2681(+)
MFVWSEMRLLFVVAAFAAVCLAQDGNGNQCGTYYAACAAIGAAEFANFNLTVEGIKANDATIAYTTYRDNNCQQQELSVTYSALYTDLGTASAPTGSRGWQVQPVKVDVTPLSADAVTMLTAACPCGLTWKINEAQGLIECPDGTCTDLTWLGADTNATLNLGSPFFGWTNVTDNSMTMSRYGGSVASIGGISNAFINLTTVNTCNPTINTDTDYCDTWLQSCVPTSDSVAVSASRIFKFVGPPQNLEKQAGTYLLQSNFYTSSGCEQAAQYMQWTEEGTMVVLDKSTNSDASVIQKSAINVLVLPQSKAAADYLNANCPCGSTVPWEQAAEKTLTTCLPGTCNTSFWYDSAPIGDDLFAVALKQLRQGDDATEAEFRLGPFSTDRGAASTATMPETAYSFLSSMTGCVYDQPFDGELCGDWLLDCAASEGLLDIGEDVEISGRLGTGVGEGSGTLTTIKTVFQPGFNCDLSKRVIEIMKIGLWSDYGNDTLGYKNSRQMLFKAATLIVTAFDDDTVKGLTTGCPCGGTWKKEMPRTLTTCPPTTCTDTALFGGAVLGEPGFGVVTIENGQLRMTDFKSNEISGFTQSMGVTVLPHDSFAPCEPIKKLSSANGIREMACRPDSEQISPFESAGNWTIQDNGHYEWFRMKYTKGFSNGCTKNMAILIKTTGKIDFESDEDSSAVVHPVHISTDVFEITPYTQEAVRILAENCDCGLIWAINQTAKIKSKCSCDLLQQNIGPDSYGVMSVDNEALRVSDLQATKDGYKTTMTGNNRNWLFQNTAPFPDKSSSKKKMSGGEIFLLVAFLGALVYIVGGMIINYRSSGTPAIPHAAFWGTVPGAISDGIYFSCCQCFGMRGSAPTYEPMASQEGKEGYGAV